jgi:hypothetical protein
MGDLVDQDPQVLVEQLARDRLLDQVKLCRARILIAADPAEKEPGEPRLSLVSGDRCLGESSRPTTRMAYPRPELSPHAMAADQLADDRCRMKGRPQRRERRVRGRATPGGSSRRRCVRPAYRRSSAPIRSRSRRFSAASSCWLELRLGSCSHQSIPISRGLVDRGDQQPNPDRCSRCRSPRG